MNALDAISNSPAVGGMTALRQSRESRASEKAEALQLGRNVTNENELERKVRNVAEDFVSVFMDQVMKSMRSTVNQNESMHGDNGEKFFQEMLDTEQSKTLAQGSGYGLTDLIYQSMIASYRVQPSQAVPSGDSAALADSLNMNTGIAVETAEAAEPVAAMAEAGLESTLQ